MGTTLAIDDDVLAAARGVHRFIVRASVKSFLRSRDRRLIASGAIESEGTEPQSGDAVDTLSSRPDFAIALYPGHLCRGGAFNASIHVTKETPPTFLLQAWDDPVDPICNSILYAGALNRAGVSAEVHLFEKGGHAFGLMDKGHPVAAWPSLVESWLKEVGVLPR